MQAGLYQYIKILTCVCVCVCLSVLDGSGMFVGRDWTIVTRDLRTLIYLHVLNLELREECVEALSGRNRASSSSSGRNRGAAVEADVIGRRAAAEAGAIREQQLDVRRRQTGSASSSGSGCRNWAREQQLKRTQAASSSWSRRNRGEAALQKLSGAGLRTVGEQGGSSWASEASSATCYLLFIHHKKEMTFATLMAYQECTKQASHTSTN